MNATDITTTVMDRIRPWLGEGADVERIHYAIERSHASVISGLSPVETTGAPFSVTPSPFAVAAYNGADSDAGVPLPIRQELARVAEARGVSYYYLCAIYRQGLADSLVQTLESDDLTITVLR